MTEAPDVAGAEKPLNAFETLTLAPIDTRLIETPAHRGRDRLDRRLSCARTDALAPPLDLSTRAWLMAATSRCRRPDLICSGWWNFCS